MRLKLSPLNVMIIDSRSCDVVLRKDELQNPKPVIKILKLRPRGVGLSISFSSSSLNIFRLSISFFDPLLLGPECQKRKQKDAGYQDQRSYTFLRLVLFLNSGQRPRRQANAARRRETVRCGATFNPLQFYERNPLKNEGQKI